MGNKPTPIRIPEELKALVQESLDEGETFAEFAREALERLCKKRGNKAKVPSVERGRPPKEKS